MGRGRQARVHSGVFALGNYVLEPHAAWPSKDPGRFRPVQSHATEEEVSGDRAAISRTRPNEGPGVYFQGACPEREDRVRTGFTLDVRVAGPFV